MMVWKVDVEHGLQVQTAIFVDQDYLQERTLLTSCDLAQSKPLRLKGINIYQVQQLAN